MTIFEKSYWVYILASRRNGTLYVGVTGNLSRRVWEHKEGNVEGFTSRYGVKLLVWYESYPDVRDAIQREKTSRSGRGAGRTSRKIGGGAGCPGQARA